MREQLLSALSWFTSSTSLPTANPQTALTFTPSGQFKISIFEDLHFGEDEFTSWAPRADAATLNVMSNILSLEQPQLAVLNGDLISGDNTYLSNSTDYLDMLVQPLVSSSTPWASTYGNHDINYNLSTAALLARERTYLLSRTNQMVFHPDAGVSNYYLPIYAPNTTNPPSPLTPPALILWFFDSLGGHAFQRLNSSTYPSSSPPQLIPLPSQVHPATTAWFLHTSALLCNQYNRTIPSLAFVHIPTEPMLEFSLHAHGGSGVDGEKEPGFADERVFRPQGGGEGEEAVGSEADGDGDTARKFVEALLTTRGLRAVFSAHQHGNDWCMATRKRPAEGGGESVVKRKQAPAPFFACFGRHTGYGGYGGWERGARQVVVDLEELGREEGGGEESGRGSIETWIRLERGGVSGYVVLNETYGEDVYPRIEKSWTRLDDVDVDVDVDVGEAG